MIDEYRNHTAIKGAPDIVDLSALFDDRVEPLYIDFAHLSEAGLAAVAEAVLPVMSCAVDGVKIRQRRSSTPPDALTP